MPFLDRLIFLNNLIPAKIYIHTAGHFEVFGENRSTPGYLSNATNYATGVLKENCDMFNKQNFLIGALWGDVAHNERVIDLFGFSGLDDWRANPEVDCWVFRSGIYSPGEPKICGDGLILLGEEEKLRRKTKDLAEYMHKEIGAESGLISGGATHFQV